MSGFESLLKDISKGLNDPKIVALNEAINRIKNNDFSQEQMEKLLMEISAIYNYSIELEQQPTFKDVLTSASTLLHNILPLVPIKEPNKMCTAFITKLLDRYVSETQTLMYFNGTKDILLSRHDKELLSGLSIFADKLEINSPNLKFCLELLWIYFTYYSSEIKQAQQGQVLSKLYLLSIQLLSTDDVAVQNKNLELFVELCSWFDPQTMQSLEDKMKKIFTSKKLAHADFIKEAKWINALLKKSDSLSSEIVVLTVNQVLKLTEKALKEKNPDDMLYNFIYSLTSLFTGICTKYPHIFVTNSAAILKIIVRCISYDPLYDYNVPIEDDFCFDDEDGYMEEEEPVDDYDESIKVRCLCLDLIQLLSNQRIIGWPTIYDNFMDALFRQLREHHGETRAKVYNTIGVLLSNCVKNNEEDVHVKKDQFDSWIKDNALPRVKKPSKVLDIGYYDFFEKYYEFIQYIHLVPHKDCQTIYKDLKSAKSDRISTILSSLSTYLLTMTKESKSSLDNQFLFSTIDDIIALITNVKLSYDIEVSLYILLDTLVLIPNTSDKKYFDKICVLYEKAAKLYETISFNTILESNKLLFLIHFISLLHPKSKYVKKSFEYLTKRMSLSDASSHSDDKQISVRFKAFVVLREVFTSDKNVDIFYDNLFDFLLHLDCNETRSRNELLLALSALIIKIIKLLDDKNVSKILKFLVEHLKFDNITIVSNCFEILSHLLQDFSSLILGNYKLYFNIFQEQYKGEIINSKVNDKFARFFVKVHTLKEVGSIYDQLYPLLKSPYNIQAVAEVISLIIYYGKDRKMTDQVISKVIKGTNNTVDSNDLLIVVNMSKYELLDEIVSHLPSLFESTSDNGSKMSAAKLLCNMVIRRDQIDLLINVGSKISPSNKKYILNAIEFILRYYIDNNLVEDKLISKIFSYLDENIASEYGQISNCLKLLKVLIPVKLFDYGAQLILKPDTIMKIHGLSLLLECIDHPLSREKFRQIDFNELLAFNPTDNFILFKENLFKVILNTYKLNPGFFTSEETLMKLLPYISPKWSNTHIVRTKVGPSEAAIDNSQKCHEYIYQLIIELYDTSRIIKQQSLKILEYTIEALGISIWAMSVHLLGMHLISHILKYNVDLVSQSFKAKKSAWLQSFNILKNHHSNEESRRDGNNTANKIADYLSSLKHVQIIADNQDFIKIYEQIVLIFNI